jgi:leader peptidase (prepilin peptidase) / N-methyltransferase
LKLPIIACFTALLLSLLVAISYVDYRELRIPDWLSASLLAGGITFWLMTARDSLPTQILSGTVLASALWLIRLAHSRIAGRIGLGLGDVKMAGAGALWISPVLLPLFVFLASASGLVYALLITRQDERGRLPFAPFLAIGLFSCWTMERYL